MPLLQDRADGPAVRDSLEALAESIPHLTWISGPDGEVQYANRKARDYLGQSLVELTGWRWESAVHPDDRDRVVRTWVEAVHSRAELQQEFRLRRHDGVYRWHIACAQPSFDADGNVCQWFGTCTDIEDRKQAEESVRESERRFRAVIEKSYDGIQLLDAAGTIVYCSPAVVRAGGRRPEEMVGHHALAWCHPDDIDEIGRQFELFLKQSGASLTGQVRYRHKDGSWRWVEFTSTNLLDDPAVGAIVVNFHDVTGKRESEDRLRRLLDGLPAAAYTVDPDGLITYFNARSVETWGRAPGLNDPGDRWCGAFRTFSPEGAPVPHDKSCLARALAENRAIRGHEMVVERPDGERRFVLAHANPLHDAEGRVIGGVNVLIDITPRKRAEAEVAEWRNRYEAAVKATGHVLYDWDAATDMIQWGGNSEQVLGYRLDELPAKLPGWVELIHPDDRAAFQRACDEAYAAREPVHLSYRVRRKDGRYIHADDHGHFVSSDKPDAQVVGFLSDVTAARQIEEQYRQAQKMEAVGKLAGGIAHDFNNLLTVINGYSEIVLASLDPGGEAYPLVDEVKKAGERAAGLTRQLLAFSRRQMLHHRVLNLNSVVADMGKMLHRVLGEDVELVLKPDRSLLKVSADPGQIEQVIVNLAVNARDAMPTGGTLVIETANVDLSAGRAADEAPVPPGRYVRLAVSDTGCGIPDELREHVFEPFFTTKKPGEGTGLGLATVYGIVRQSGGHITFDSQVGRGTTFRVYLPVVGAASSVIENSSASSPLPGGIETILVVEDEAGVRGMTRLLLQRLGYNVLDASTAEEAVAIFRNSSGPIDLLLTDVVMPGISGRVIAEQLQMLDPRLRVVFMSGYTDDAVVRHGVERDEVHFLAKPYTASALARAVRAALGAVPG